MTAEEFKVELKNPKNIYCLVSSDSKMIDIYIERFKKAIEADQIVYGKILPYGKLFRKKTINVLYVTKLEEDMFNRDEYIFMHIDKIDKRSAVYKKYKDRFIELTPNYTKFIMDHSDLNKEQSEKFAISCNNDLGIIEHTLSIYNQSNSDYNNFVDYFGDIYLWVDNFIKKEPLPIIQESPMSILALLATNCYNLLQVKQNNTSGLKPYTIKCLNELKSYRSEQELANIISTCYYLESQLVKGLMPADILIDYLIASDK